jgi:mannan endo-1,4-beta-mannosidase
VPQSWGQSANETLWGVDWINSHAAAQKTVNKPVLLEEFGVTSNQSSTYQLWWNTVLSSGLTGKSQPILPHLDEYILNNLVLGNLIWQAGSQLSNGPSPNDGFAVYPTGTVYPVMKSAAAALKARG